MTDKEYYVQKYEDRMDEIYRELKGQDVEDIDFSCTMEFDETANAEEVVGYYLINYEENPLKGWLENLQHASNLTVQDNEVTRILTDLSGYRSFDMNINEILAHDETFRYQLLSRMQSDCNYYLGNGNRHSKHLWGGTEKEHIGYMKAIWNSFPEDRKPEWLSYEEICDYEKKMDPEKSITNGEGFMNKIEKWEIKDEHAHLTYSDGEVVKVTKEDFNRAFGAIVNASKEAVVRDFGVKDNPSLSDKISAADARSKNQTMGMEANLQEPTR